MASRVSISLDKEQEKLLELVMGFGNKKAEIVKNIMIAYLSEKGYIGKLNEEKKRIK